MKKSTIPWLYSWFLFLPVFFLIDVNDASGIPAFGRKYGMDCATCHAPAVPKLNAMGHRFRKMGFRFENEIGQKQEYKEIGNYISMRGRGRYNYTDPETGDPTSRFQWNDATLFYAGAITENLTGFFEWEWEDADDIALNAYIGWLMGNANQFWTIRFGQFHPIYRVGWGGFDRPAGISTPDMFSSRALTDSTVPFRIAEDQKGIEFAYNFNQNSRFIAQLLNGLNFDGRGNEGSADDDRDKDFVLAYEQMIGDEGSGFTLFTYRGVFHKEPGTVVGTTALGEDIELGDRDDETQFNFWRVGATADFAHKWCPLGITELIGGYVFSLDELPNDYPVLLAGEDDEIKGHTLFFEIDQHLPHESALFSRVDLIKPDEDLDFRQRYTFGGLYTVVDYLRLSSEIFFLNEENRQNRDVYGVVAEAMFNF